MHKGFLTALTCSVVAHVAAAGWLWVPPQKTAPTLVSVVSVRLAQAERTQPERIPAPPPAAIKSEPALMKTGMTARATVAPRPGQGQAATPVVESVAPAPRTATPAARQMATSPPTASAAPETAAVETLTLRIQQLLAGHFHYPRLARQRGWQGVVEISLHITAAGDIRQVALHQPSGYRTLDQAALECASKLTSLSGALADLAPRGLDLIIPIHYRLQDS